MANILRTGGSGGGATETLPPMITGLRAVGGNTKITVSWENPESDILAGVLLVYNSDHIPTKPTDGKKIDAKMSESIVLLGLPNTVEQFIRVFPYNSKKQYQTLLEGSTTSATPNIGPAQVTNFTVTGSGSAPVLSWNNPTSDPLYSVTVVVQKEDSPPTDITDGTEIYRGTGETVTASGLVRLSEYYWAIFTVSVEGSYGTPVFSEMYSYNFPDKPTSWIEIVKPTSNYTFIAPETGWFMFIGLAMSGGGGKGDAYSNSEGVHKTGGGGGGSGGIIVSRFALSEGESASITINGLETSIIYKDHKSTAKSGTVGEAAKGSKVGNGGIGGAASGGTVANIRGSNGGSGSRAPYDDSKRAGGDGGRTTYMNYVTAGGSGGEKNILPSGGTAAYAVILRGNTNIPSPTQVNALSLIPRNTVIEATWENSGDPEQAGTLVVTNENHEPSSYEDGTVVDVQDATSYTIENLSNDKPTYVSLFPYNADKTRYGFPKTDVEIPREVTWYDTQTELEGDLEESNEMVTSAKGTIQTLIVVDIQNGTEFVSDNMILDNADMLSKAWEVGVSNEVGDIVWYIKDDVKQYYKTITNTENADPNHTPDLIPAVFVPINRGHAGTVDDPIPAVRGMEYEYGKYYLDNEDGNIYLCKRGEETGTIVLQFLPHELIGQYFELYKGE